MDAPFNDFHLLLGELNELRGLLDQAAREGDLESLITACKNLPPLELKTELLLFAP